MRTAIVAEQIQKKKEKRRNMALFIELLLMGVGLAMDAFAVSVCKGLGMKKLNKKQAVVIGLYFGGFQALMRLWDGFLEFSSKSILQVLITGSHLFCLALSVGK